MGMDTFRDKVVIITGASSGIGRQMAYELVQRGAWLSLGARNLERLNEVADVCQQRGGRALVVQTDVRERTQCQDLVAATMNEYERIDMLCNNAGITMWARFDEMQTFEPFEDIMQVNYLGSLYMTYYALPYLKQVNGRILAVASVAGKTGVPLRSGYVASKHAMIGFFDALRIELKDTGVSVTIVLPDFVATETRMRAFGVDGQPLQRSPIREGKVMTVEKCAQVTIDAAAKRKREVILSKRGVIGQWIKLFAPGIVDKIASRAIRRGQ